MYFVTILHFFTIFLPLTQYSATEIYIQFLSVGSVSKTIILNIFLYVCEMQGRA
jgi:hypothetical protein